MTDITDPHLTLKELEEITGLDSRKLYRWTVEGRLPFVQPFPNAKIYIKLSDLENLLIARLLK